MAQIRNRGNHLHVQVGSNALVNNRSYGGAFDIQNDLVPNSVLAALGETEHTISSLAGTGARYTGATIGTDLENLVVTVNADGADVTFTVPLSEVGVFN